MTDDVERSPSGTPILRHEAVAHDWEPAQVGSHRQEVEAFLGRVLGTPEAVFHEIVSDLVHIDVHFVPPSPERDHWTLFTTGMSDRPMTVPEELDDYRFAELCVKIPSSWRFDLLQVTPPPPDLERWYWPIRWLKTLARLPHDYDTWLSTGHTVPNGDPPAPFAEGTDLCAWLLLPPIAIPPEERTLRLPDGTLVNLYVLRAVHSDELALNLDKGMDALLARFDEAGVSEVLDLSRPSSIRTRRFGLFGR